MATTSKRRAAKKPARKASTSKKKRPAKKIAAKKPAVRKAAGGRPPHKPTPELRDRASRLVGYGLIRKQVAKIMRLDDKTVSKYYSDELQTGDLQANVTVAASLYRMAVGAPAQYDENGNLLREEQKPIPLVAIFWAKARMGWQPPPKEHRFGGSADAPPIQQVTVVGNIDTANPEANDPIDLAAFYAAALEAASTVH